MSVSRKQYWFTACAFCNQGRLFLVKNVTANALYLHCEECEWGWRDPEQVGDLTACFLTLDEDFDAEMASWKDIEDAGWQQYVSPESL